MTKVVRHLLTALAFGVLMATLSIWTAPRLIAQIRAALVKNVDELGRVPYDSGLVGFNFNGCSQNCTKDVTGSASVNTIVPSGKRLIVNHIRGGTDQGEASIVGLSSAPFSANGYDFADKLVFTGPFSSPFNGTSYYDIQTFLTFEPGSTIHFATSFASCFDNNFANCNGFVRISGYLIDATN